MLRTPMKLALEATVFTAVLAWEVYKRTPFRPKASRSVPAEVDEVDAGSHGHPMHDVTWHLFPDFPDEDGDRFSMTLESRISDFCPQCGDLDDFVTFAVNYVVSKVEGVKQEMHGE